MLHEHELRAIHDHLSNPEGVSNGGFQLGVFVVGIDHVGQQLTSTPDGFEQFFTSAERDHCQLKMPSFAGRFAGKHAVIEVLGQELPWQSISIGRDQSGKPYVELTGDAQRLAEEREIRTIPISISHDEGLAVSFAAGVLDPSLNVTLGTDITSARRIDRVYRKLGDHFLRRVFSDEEADEAAGNPVRLAEKWAGKEAVAKVLGTGVWGAGVAWTDISILTENGGLSRVNLTGKALEQADRRGLVNWRIHIVHNTDTPFAFVLGSS